MTHCFLHRSGSQNIRHSRVFHAECMVGPSGVVETDPFSGDARGMLLGFESVTMEALLFRRSENAFDNEILLRAVRRNELL